MQNDNNYRILIVHPGFSKHIRRFVRRLRQYNENAHIEFLTTCSTSVEIPSDIAEYVETIHYIKLYTQQSCSNRILRFIRNYFYVRKQIQSFSKKEKYDVINIHFPNVYIAYGAKYYKRMCKKLLLTPWGSDVYQLNAWSRHNISKLYKNADNISGIGNKFTRDFQKMFKVPSDKIVNLSIASETADYICTHKNSLTKEEAKDKIGIKGYYGIVCGYNGNPIGNHIPMFEAIKKIKDEIPEPIMIMVQITYGYTTDYLNKLKNYIKDNGLNAIFFDKYMELDDLYCLMMAADMFVFVADSDSNSGVLKEYIYLEKKVVLGEWLKYDDLQECSSLPYYPVKSMESLSDAIKKAYFSKPLQIDPNWKKNFENAGYDYWAPKWDDYYISCLD